MIDPIQSQRKFTRDFFDQSEPLTPIAKKKMSPIKLFEIQILDGNITCDTGKTYQEKETRQTTLFGSNFTQPTDLTRFDSCSPSAVLEEKPILELNI